MYAEFTDELITGNEMIDSQHRELIGKINDLLITCENKDAPDKVIQMVHYLTDYTNFHFAAEEKLQRDLEYPGYGQHKQQHDAFCQSVAQLHDKIVNGESMDALTELIKKEVVDWLYYHIQGFDRSVAEFIFLRDNPDLL